MLSVVVPVLNEEASLALLHGELVTALKAASLDYEIIFVDDGSTDGSWQQIKQLAEKDESVIGLRFRTNFGKAEALSAGFDQARGEMILTIDADLQDDPQDIPKLLARLQQGYDVVSGWKQDRKDPWTRVAGSRVFNWLVSAWTGVQLHDHNCGFKLFNAEVCREIRLYGDLHRFVAVLAAARGFKVTEVGVHHRARPFGGLAIRLGPDPSWPTGPRHGPVLDRVWAAAPALIRDFRSARFLLRQPRAAGVGRLVVRFAVRLGRWRVAGPTADPPAHAAGVLLVAGSHDLRGAANIDGFLGGVICRLPTARSGHLLGLRNGR